MGELTILSLGWGVQSFTLAAMVAIGELPPIDYAIHADTGWERSETYVFAKRWTPWLKEHGVNVIDIHDKLQLQKMFIDKPDVSLFDRWNGLLLPAFTTWLNGKSSGMLRRQCTNHWKIQPMRRWISVELQRRGLSKSPGIVEQWIGFTLDEAHRAKPNDVRYIINRYPYLEMFPQMYTRQMCIGWLRDHDLEVPVKSACIICPYHNFWAWRDIQLADNGDWQRAIDVDRAIRDKRLNYKCYLCSDCRPLEDHDFNCMTLW